MVMSLRRTRYRAKLVVLLVAVSLSSYIGAGELHVGDIHASGYSGFKRPELIEALENKDTWKIGEIDPSRIWLATTLESATPLEVRMRVYLRMKVGTIRFEEGKGIDVKSLKQSAVWGKENLLADEPLKVSSKAVTKYLFRYSLDDLMSSLVKSNRWPVVLEFTFKAEKDGGVSTVTSKTIHLIPDNKRAY